VVGQDYDPPAGYAPTMALPMLGNAAGAVARNVGWIPVPALTNAYASQRARSVDPVIDPSADPEQQATLRYLAGGDLSGFDRLSQAAAAAPHVL